MLSAYSATTRLHQLNLHMIENHWSKNALETLFLIMSIPQVNELASFFFSKMSSKVCLELTRTKGWLQSQDEASGSYLEQKKLTPEGKYLLNFTAIFSKQNLAYDTKSTIFHIPVPGIPLPWTLSRKKTQITKMCALTMFKKGEWKALSIPITDAVLIGGLKYLIHF